MFFLKFLVGKWFALVLFLLLVVIVVVVVLAKKLVANGLSTFGSYVGRNNFIFVIL